jgi:D-alanyl-D-alanine carboxypeptidase
MYKHFSKIAVIITLIFSLNVITYAAQPTNINSKQPTISGGSAILINAQTGQIIYEKNANQARYPASTTKVLTALLAVEHLNPNKILTVSKSACAIPGDRSSVGLKAGEQMSVNNLLHALLINSANESANTLAEGVSGSIPAFVKLMNKRARELGAKNSNFVTPHGYHDPKHYTTAYDLAKITMEAMKKPLIRAIVKTQIYKIPPTNIHKSGIYLSNTNKLVNKYRGSAYFYPYAEGVKPALQVLQNIL